MLTWDEMFIRLAETVANKSKDPRTKVGAVLVSPDRRQIAIGFNGFPSGIPDDIEVLNRQSYFHGGIGKDDLVIHAELNAILNCHVRPQGWTLYCTHAPCSECAKHIVAAGIRTLVYGAGACTKTDLSRGINVLGFAGVTYYAIPSV